MLKDFETRIGHFACKLLSVDVPIRPTAVSVSGICSPADGKGKMLGGASLVFLCRVLSLTTRHASLHASRRYFPFKLIQGRLVASCKVFKKIFFYI